MATTIRALVGGFMGGRLVRWMMNHVRQAAAATSVMIAPQAATSPECPMPVRRSRRRWTMGRTASVTTIVTTGMTSTAASGTRTGSVSRAPSTSFWVLDHLDRDVDVATRGFRVRADLVRRVGKFLGGRGVQAGEGDVQAGPELIAAGVGAQIHFRIDRAALREPGLLLRG